MRATDLQGEAKRVFDSWRAAGYTETQALEEVERSGVLHEDQLYGIFKGLGMSENAARTAARGRVGTTAGGPFDELVGAFRLLGMSGDAARTAAVGRDMTERQARQVLAAGDVQASLQQAFGAAVRACQSFHDMTEANAKAWITKKLDTEWAPLSPAERIIELTSYAKTFGSGAKAADLPAPPAPATPVAESYGRGQVVELREVIGWTSWPKATRD
ncbi:hypothetical protein ACQP10_08525 [Streptosporangium sandarakinum]|uniref:hypothetical protein n=1 Tax=Streptosporangium sandarakinum TaxID=1260955 RepID=UPI003D922303